MSKPLLSRLLFNRLIAALASITLCPAWLLAFERRSELRPRKAEESESGVAAILFYGQSNAGPGGRGRAILTKPVAPDRIFTFGTTREVYGTKLLDGARLQGVGHLQDLVNEPPAPATAMAFALGELSRRRYFLHTVWYGGEPLTSFLPGTTSWSDLLTVARRVPQVLAEQSLHGNISALVLIQGESGPPGRRRYAHILQDFLSTALSELKAQAEQDRLPIAILVQTNASNAQSATALGVALAQWDVVRSRPQDTVLAGPTYQFPLEDSVHQSAEGRMMLGDLLALVYQTRVERDESFEPLHPIDARRIKNMIVIAFKRPKRAAPLQWDRNWVPPVPDFGFQVRSEGKPLPIEAVEITGASEVTIRLSPGQPNTGLIVHYAMEQPHITGWAPGRGQLMAPTTIPSAFARLGAQIPDRIFHYAIRFEMPVDSEIP